MELENFKHVGKDPFNGRNFITPTLQGLYSNAVFAVELSSGFGLFGNELFGVSVKYFDNPSIDATLSEVFTEEDKAKEYALNLLSNKLFVTYFNYIEFVVPTWFDDRMVVSGSCDSDIEEFLEDSIIKVQFNRLDASKVATELEQYGAWTDEELKDTEQNKRRILWIAVGDYRDRLDEADIE